MAVGRPGANPTRVRASAMPFDGGRARNCRFERSDIETLEGADGPGVFGVVGRAASHIKDIGGGENLKLAMLEAFESYARERPDQHPSGLIFEPCPDGEWRRRMNRLAEEFPDREEPQRP